MRFHSYFSGSTQEPFKTLNDLYKSLRYGLEIFRVMIVMFICQLTWGPIRHSIQDLMHEKSRELRVQNVTNPTDVCWKHPRNTIQILHDHSHKLYIYTSEYVRIVNIYIYSHKMHLTPPFRPTFDQDTEISARTRQYLDTTGKDSHPDVA